MKLQILSDLHLEWYQNGAAFVKQLLIQKPSEVDVLVLAGDIVNFRAQQQTVAIHQLSLFCEAYPAVFYVPGNHEYYGTAYDTVHEQLRLIESRYPFYVLTPGNVVAGLGASSSGYLGTRFIGGTLWFPHTKGIEAHYPNIGDFSCIQDDFPRWAYAHNEGLRRQLEEDLREGDIVITHHLPSRRSIHPQFATSLLNRFFVSDEEQLIVKKQPAVWIHGHTHHAMDYHIGKTRIVCNPAGYVDRLGNVENTRFIPDLVVEI